VRTSGETEERRVVSEVGDRVEDAVQDGTAGEFRRWFADAEPRLRRAFAGTRDPDDAHDAVAEALGYAWEHWSRIREMDNGVGYVFRVGMSRTRVRTHGRRGVEPALPAVGVPEIEPALVPALNALPPKQRLAVWLVHACDWSHQEVAEAMGVSPSTVSTHVGRGLAALRRELEVTTDA
jgi:DNA-directed RNA polymerase specialized sigma24 family protein